MQKNVTYAFVDVLEKILKEGTSVTARGSEQIEKLAHLLQIENPKERVMLLPRRNNNIFALVAETMWVVGGRDDLEFLSHYLPRAVDFSDDGKVWRAAYGPRLRNWHGVDQFKEVVKRIDEDKNTKRAVMVIFDPQSDYVETKDVPCNNWLHFMARDGKLNLNVAVRANDAVWGFGGINSFEWTLLHEMMSFWTGNEVGTLSWFAGTIHIYKRHYKRAQNILNEFRNKTLYEFGIGSPKFSTPLSEFDGEMQRWFDIECKIRTKIEFDAYDEIQQISDELLRNSLEMVYIYNLYLNNEPKEKIAELVEKLPTNDYKIAAIEYFARAYKQKDLIKLNEKEQEFFDFYWYIENLEQQLDVSEQRVAR